MKLQSYERYRGRRGRAGRGWGLCLLLLRERAAIRVAEAIKGYLLPGRGDGACVPDACVTCQAVAGTLCSHTGCLLAEVSAQGSVMPPCFRHPNNAPDFSRSLMSQSATLLALQNAVNECDIAVKSLNVIWLPWQQPGICMPRRNEALTAVA